MKSSSLDGRISIHWCVLTSIHCSFHRVASRVRFPWDRALIRIQTRIFLESAVTKLYEKAQYTRRCGKYMKRKDERSRKSKHCMDREFVEVLIFPSKRSSNNSVDDCGFVIVYKLKYIYIRYEVRTVFGHIITKNIKLN